MFGYISLTNLYDEDLMLLVLIFFQYRQPSYINPPINPSNHLLVVKFFNVDNPHV